MTQPIQGRILRYGCAVASVGVAVAIRLLLDPLFGDQFPFATIFLAVLFTAWCGGFRPALAAVVLGAVASDFFLLQPRGSLLFGGVNQKVGVILYLATGLGIAFLGGAMQAARRRAESSAESAANQAALIDQTHDAVLVWDWNGAITFWNQGAEHLYGFRRQEAIGRGSDELLNTRPEGGVPTFIDVLGRTGVWEGELHHVHRDGRPLHVESRMVLIRHADRSYVLEANRDITARKTAEAALRAANELLEMRVQARTAELDQTNQFLQASEERYRLLVDGVHSYAIFMVDPAAKVMTWNEGAQRITGYEAREITGRHVSCLYSDADNAGDLPAQEFQFAAAAGRCERDGWRIRKDGTRFWARSVLTALPGRGFALLIRDITEAKRTEELLLHSEASLRAERDWLTKIVATVPVVICSFRMRPDGSAYFPFANPRLEEIYSVPAEDLALDAAPVFSRMHPDDVDRVREGIEESARAMSVWRIEYRVRHPVRGDIWVEGNSMPTRESNGDILWLGYVADITARRLIEESLQATETSLRLLIEGVSDHAICMLDPTGNVLTWNKGAERIDGYSAEEIVGRNMSCLFTPQDIDSGEPQQELAHAAAEGKAEIDGWRVRKDGSRFWANGTVAALYDDGHRVRGFAKITRDLTAKRRNDELLRSVLDNTLDAIISIDEQGIISMINRAGRIMFGRSEAEVIGNNVRMLMPAPYHAQHDGYLTNFLRTGDAKIIGIGREVEGLRKDGSIFPIDLAVTEFRLDHQRFFVGIVRDISERRTLETQLRQSQKMEAFGQLAGGVAHDFNNLLTVISGYSDILLTTLPPDDVNREMIDEIRRAGERATSLTRQLLAFTRQQVLEPKIVDLNAILKGTESMLRRLIGEDVQFSSVLRPNISSVKVDPGQIEQVLLNLAVNARDAMPRGGKLTVETSEIELHDKYVRLHPGARPGRYVMLAISDTGSGMTPEVKSRIFEPFFTTKGGKGTGLGLAVVQGIVKQSGGTIELYSEAGVGTVFKIYLPASPGEQPTPSEPALLRSAGGHETILVVEDEDGVRQLVVVALMGLGYKVLAAASGAAALQVMAAYRQDVHLLVTDVVMPGMSGRLLAETLQPEHPALKVLFLSGYTDDAVVRHGVLQAHVAFLQKPFTQPSLAKKVREVLDSG